MIKDKKKKKKIAVVVVQECMQLMESEELKGLKKKNASILVEGEG